MENDPRGNENWFKLAGVRVIGGSSELPRVKLQEMYDRHPGEIDFGSSLARDSS